MELWLAQEKSISYENTLGLSCDTQKYLIGYKHRSTGIQMTHYSHQTYSNCGSNGKMNSICWAKLPYPDTKPLQWMVLQSTVLLWSFFMSVDLTKTLNSVIPLFTHTLKH